MERICINLAVQTNMSISFDIQSEVFWNHQHISQIFWYFPICKTTDKARPATSEDGGQQKTHHHNKILPSCLLDDICNCILGTISKVNIPRYIGWPWLKTGDESLENFGIIKCVSYNIFKMYTKLHEFPISLKCLIFLPVNRSSRCSHDIIWQKLFIWFAIWSMAL